MVARAYPIQTIGPELQERISHHVTHPLSVEVGAGLSVVRVWSKEIDDAEGEYRFRTPKIRSFEHVAGISHNFYYVS